jgi:hypothetical protein
MDDILDVIRSLGLETNILGRALIVCGTAFVCSGLVFLLPGRPNKAEKAFRENVSEIDVHLDRMRREQ